MPMNSFVTFLSHLIQDCLDRQRRIALGAIIYEHIGVPFVPDRLLHDSDDFSPHLRRSATIVVYGSARFLVDS
jgi:hypothetical protein